MLKKFYKIIDQQQKALTQLKDMSVVQQLVHLQKIHNDMQATINLLQKTDQKITAHQASLQKIAIIQQSGLGTIYTRHIDPETVIMQTPTITITPASPFPKNELQKICRLATTNPRQAQCGYVYPIRQYTAIEQIVYRYLYLKTLSSVRKDYSTTIPASYYLCVAFKSNDNYLQHYQQLRQTYLQINKNLTQNIYDESFTLTNGSQVTELRIPLDLPKPTS